MRLLLGGGGQAHDEQLLLALLVQLMAGGTMLYLPIAQNPHRQSFGLSTSLGSIFDWLRKFNRIVKKSQQK